MFDQVNYMHVSYLLLALSLCLGLGVSMSRWSRGIKPRRIREGTAAFTRREVCSACGYVHYAPSPHPLIGPGRCPEVCPKCGDEMKTHTMRRRWKERKFGFWVFKVKDSQWWEYRRPGSGDLREFRTKGGCPYCSHDEHESNIDTQGWCPAENCDCSGGH